MLREEGVEVILGQRAHIEKAVDGTSKVTLTDGSVIEVGAVFDGRSGVVPVTQCLPSEALDEHGYVKILPKYVITLCGRFRIFVRSPTDLASLRLSETRSPVRFLISADTPALQPHTSNHSTERIFTSVHRRYMCLVWNQTGG